MKKFCLFVVLPFFIELDSSIAQSYTPFPINNAIWCQYEMVTMPPFSKWPYFLKFKGDTIINSTNYNKLYSSWLDTVNFNGYVGGLRQDYANKKTYFIYNGETEENIIYDFALQEGDTFYIHYPNEQPWFDILINKDSVEIVDGTYRKRFNFNDSYMNTWVEGIGCMRTFIYRPIGLEGDVRFNCLTENTNVIYHNPGSFFNQCFNFVGINEAPQNEYTFKVSLQANNIINITCHQNKNENIDFTMYDMFGKQVYKVNRNLLAGSNTLSLNIPNFSAGIYLYKIETHLSVSFCTGKLIIK
ncbi:MAG: hypothetical protein AUJ97_08545 [Bacteroidetes bacterium CG2_30_32_10]|nr:MAG: hypothetical protein AUJ97_08545 [Bacteroidetes bacterium CG2_30_32_10]